MIIQLERALHILITQGVYLIAVLIQINKLLIKSKQNDSYMKCRWFINFFYQKYVDILIDSLIDLPKATLTQDTIDYLSSCTWWEQHLNYKIIIPKQMSVVSMHRQKYKTRRFWTEKRNLNTNKARMSCICEIFRFSRF